MLKINFTLIYFTFAVIAANLTLCIYSLSLLRQSEKDVHFWGRGKEYQMSRFGRMVQSQVDKWMH